MLFKTVRSVLNKLRKRDDWFHVEYTVNPYEGCSCNCLYCYIRGSKYGENMAEGLAVKSNALEVLNKQLKNRAAKNQYGFVALGSATDAYLPQEADQKLTEGFLNLLLKYRFPVFISTKRDLITRDIAILKAIDQQAILPGDLKSSIGRGLILSVSLSSLNEQVTRILEPAAIAPLKRLELVQHLKDEGFFVGVNAIPLLPFISDTNDELEKIIVAAKEHRADYILCGSLTLFGNEKADSKTLYYKFLERYKIDLIPYYDELYNGFPYPPKSYQAALKERTDILCKKYNIRNHIPT